MTAVGAYAGQTIAVDVLLDLVSVNVRRHWGTVARDRRRQRAMVDKALAGLDAPSGEVRVHLHRVGVKRLDPDNLVASCKTVVDAVAEWLRVDDAHLEVTYSQSLTRAKRQDLNRFGHRIVVPDCRVRIAIEVLQ